MSTEYRGRFAPSPTGDLHFGSLLAAVGSYLQARAARGLWYVRIEDIDPPREVPGAARAQLETLRRFGLVPDGPVQWQSSMQDAHMLALRKLAADGLAYPCACARRDLPKSGIYPGTCRAGIAAGRPARSIRFRVKPGPVRFKDAVQGSCEQDLELDVGDFVIRRADGLVAYQLAVVVDDARARISEVVRGADLLDSTPRQISLYRALGLPEPAWMHLPLVTDEHGRKLSKSSRDDPVNRHRPATVLRLVLRALGHEPPAGRRSLESQLSWAVAHWSAHAIPRGPVGIGVHTG